MRAVTVLHHVIGSPVNARMVNVKMDGQDQIVKVTISNPSSTMNTNILCVHEWRLELKKRYGPNSPRRFYI